MYVGAKGVNAVRSLAQSHQKSYSIRVLRKCVGIESCLDGIPFEGEICHAKSTSSMLRISLNYVYFGGDESLSKHSSFIRNLGGGICLFVIFYYVVGVYFLADSCFFAAKNAVPMSICL